MKILVVDDDRDLVERLGLCLHLAGFTPVPAFSPAATIERFEHERADLVLLDVELGPWSGLDLLEELRKRSQVPILMLTGCASESVEARSFELGADDYLQKPISTRSLIARIRAVLSRYQRAQEQAEVHVQLNAALRELVEARNRALAEAGQAARARDEGLALAAYDLLEPLTVIKSVTQLYRARSVQPGTPDTDPVVEALAQIEANASKMARQLVDLLGGTRLEIEQLLELCRRHLVLSGAQRQAVAGPRWSLPPPTAEQDPSGLTTARARNKVRGVGPTAHPGPSTHEERILVVDDEDAVRGTVVQMLEGDGYVADEAAKWPSQPACASR